jgi:ubiquinone/menaquinone biosynthesis C-methylase UbiE
VLIDRDPLADIRVTADPRPYALGYSEREFRRLEMQGGFYADLTEDLLGRAGIRPGMRVLDLGCGVGDVSLMAGRLVGPSGLVLGVDRSADAIATAEKRASAAGQCYWVRFAASEIDDFVPDGTFDAIIGRLVLMYLPDPVATLRRLSARLAPGGIVAFQEFSMPSARSFPDVPLFRQCLDRIIGTFERAGFEHRMGDKLLGTYLAAGLPEPEMVASGRVEAGPRSVVYDYVAETMRSLLPAMERTGVATPAEIDVDTLAARLRRETLDRGACVYPPTFIGAWTRTAE